jgi:hypothetical protein
MIKSSIKKWTGLVARMERRLLHVEKPERIRLLRKI